jgi:hypothetical protein
MSDSPDTGRLLPRLLARLPDWELNGLFADVAFGPFMTHFGH